MSNLKTVLAASALSVFALSLASATQAATVTLGFDEPVPEPLSLDADSPGIVGGNCLDAPCLGVNSEDPATLSTADGSTFSVSSFWFELLGEPTDLIVTTSSGEVTLDADTYGHNDGGQFYDVAGNPLFQNITSLSFLTSFGNARVDDVVLSVNAVPLPGSALLLLGGILGLAAARRRRMANA
jgi:hypothetical protein